MGTTKSTVSRLIGWQACTVAHLAEEICQAVGAKSNSSWYRSDRPREAQLCVASASHKHVRSTAFRGNAHRCARALIRAHPLGTLVTLGAEGLNGTTFRSCRSRSRTARNADRPCVARQSAWRDFDPQVQALVVFRDDSYITPSWYPTSNRRQGRADLELRRRARLRFLRIVEDAARLRAIVESLTSANESSGRSLEGVGPRRRNTSTDASGIVGIEIEIRRLVAMEGKPEPRSGRRGV